MVNESVNRNEVIDECIDAIMVRSEGWRLRKPKSKIEQNSFDTRYIECICIIDLLRSKKNR